ncbi:MAG: alcohol acetyltransferase, partial [Oscillospiraceae bacterium]|nr:alcohol acetyltransferase [Oscillospiraceae bacterium]
MRNIRWFRLDTAALIFPAIKEHNWNNLFRVSATLKEEVDPSVLQTAVINLMPRFPSFYVRLRKGLFWNYLQNIESPPVVREDYAYPLVFMGSEEMKKCCLRVLYYKNRVAAEFFHSVSDGTGGSIYLRTLVGEYLRIKHGLAIEYDDSVLDPADKPRVYELEDSFSKNAGKVAGRELGRKA